MPGSTRGEMFSGCTVALVTPFTSDGSVDHESLRKLVDWHLEQGTRIISPVGTTGESPTLAHKEHEEVIATVIERVGGRARVLPGTGSNATAEAVRLTQFAKRAGADGALLISPYYNRPTQEGLYRHYAAVAESTDIPMVLYNVPARTGRNLDAETVERLAAFTPVVAVKEASGSLDQVSDLVARTDLTILSGDDSLTLPMMAVGAQGVISVVANLVPRDVNAMIDAFQSGHLEEARRLHFALFPLCRDLLGLAPNPIPVKTALALLGRASGDLRLPMCPPDERGTALLRASLERYGLLSG
ncbi:MAG TPA: 4-hydroxy-tetrahydrodipicolinate synthase [Isosphaeraceae bacterium]|nr:4-hydroxy-tetrahydrodipicolinate synthase [Isosphaeraceae bacterium]